MVTVTHAPRDASPSSVAATAAIIISFLFNDAATTAIYTLSLHDALPISNARLGAGICRSRALRDARVPVGLGVDGSDRKSTRLNSSHLGISYAVFCLKKKKTQ